MKVLIVDDEVSLCSVLVGYLNELDVTEIDEAYNGVDALELVKNTNYDLVITDIKMPRMNGVELTKNIRKIDKSLKIVLISGQSEVIESINAIELGAYDFLVKPIDTDKLSNIVKEIQNINSSCRGDFNNLNYQDSLLNGDIRIDDFRLENFMLNGHIICSDIMKSIHKKMIKLLEYPEIPVLIEGKTGTGKEVVASFLYNDKTMPFVGVNCAAIPKDIFESELFGYDRGAFTGADSRGKEGKIEASKGGILFLDEITEIPVEVQVKLLRVLQEKEYYGVGSNHKKIIKSRIITATNKSIPKLIREGKFREDLYYRLNICKITVPSLKDRKEDILPLMIYFIKKFYEGKISVNQKMVRIISKCAIDLATEYEWPGNVRELSNTVTKALLFKEDETLTSDDFKNFIKSKQKIRSFNMSTTAIIDKLLDNPFSLDDLNIEIVDAALKKFDGNKTKAASYLGLNRIQLYHRFKTERKSKN